MKGFYVCSKIRLGSAYLKGFKIVMYRWIVDKFEGRKVR